MRPHLPNSGYFSYVPDTRTSVLAWRDGVSDGGTERPLRRRGTYPDLSRRVPDAQGSRLFSSLSGKETETLDCGRPLKHEGSAETEGFGECPPH